MSSLTIFKLCGFYDYSVELHGKDKNRSGPTYLPRPIYSKDNVNYLGFGNSKDVITNFMSMSTFSDISEDGVITKFKSNIERKVGDRFLHAFRLSNRIFIGEREDIIEIIHQNKRLLNMDKKFHYPEVLVFAKERNECKNYYRIMSGYAIDRKERERNMANIDHVDTRINSDGQMLIDKDELHVYIHDLNKLKDSISEIRFKPKYLKCLKERNPEYFVV